MNHKKLPASAWLTMMKAYKNNNKEEKVIELFAKNKRIFGNEKSLNNSYLLALLLSLKSIKFYYNDNNKSKANLFNTIASHSKKLIESGCGNKHLISTLLTFYGKIGEINNAIEIFDNIDNKRKDIVTYVAMMQAYIENNMNEEAISLYFGNDLEKFENNICFTIALTACSNIKDAKNGKKIHQFMIDKNINNDIELSNTLITFYGKIGEINNAIDMFDNIDNSKKSIVTYTAMMRGYIQNNMNEEAISLYFDNDLEKFENNICFTIALTACSNIKDAKNGKKIHQFIIDKNNNDNSIELSNTLITFYTKIGEINNSIKVFNNIDKNKKDFITYISILKTFGKGKIYKNELDYIANEVWTNKNMYYNAKIISQLISCYGKQGFIDESKNVFCKYLNYIKNNNNRVDNSLLFIFSAMITAFGNSQRGNDAIDFYENHLKNNASKYSLVFKNLVENSILESFSNNNNINDTNFENISIIYLALINACSHSNMVLKGQFYFDEYINNYWDKIDIKFQLNGFDTFSKINSALIDGYARSGDLINGLNLIKKTCKENDSKFKKYMNNINNYKYVDFELSLYLILLSGCKVTNNAIIGMDVYNTIKEIYFDNIDSDNNSNDSNLKDIKNIMASSSVLIRNILHANNKSKQANRIENERIKNGWFKKPGISQTNFHGTIYEFKVKDEYKYGIKYGKLIEKQMNKWSNKLKKYGFKHDHTCVTRDLEEHETIEKVLCSHSEKLALAMIFVLENEYKNKLDIIQINKNLRMCADCHEATKLISFFEKRKINVSDANTMHKFDNGHCSCDSFW